MQQQPVDMGQMQQSNHIMYQPPTIVSNKDLLYLQDMMAWNLNAAKKAHFFAQQCTIPEIKSTLEQVCQMHQKHYQKILQHTNLPSNGMVQ